MTGSTSFNSDVRCVLYNRKSLLLEHNIQRNCNICDGRTYAVPHVDASALREGKDMSREKILFPLIEFHSLF